MCTSLNLSVGVGVIVMEFLTAAFPDTSEVWVKRCQMDQSIAKTHEYFSTIRKRVREQQLIRASHHNTSHRSSSVQPLPGTDVNASESVAQSETRPMSPARSIASAEGGATRKSRTIMTEL